MEKKKCLIRSEDGVPLFENDKYYRAGRSGAIGAGPWSLFEAPPLKGCHFVCCYPEIDKAFVSKKKALKFIEEKNNER